MAAIYRIDESRGERGKPLDSAMPGFRQTRIGAL
jgi:hypothetical protein